MSRTVRDPGSSPASKVGEESLEGDLGETDTGRPASEPDAVEVDAEGDASQSWPGRSFGTILPPG